MKRFTLALLAVLAAAPALADQSFVINFDKTWNYSNGDINNYYNGGAAADGSTGGPNDHVVFKNVSGLSNDALGPYYANSPSPKGVAYAHNTAFLDVAAGAYSGVSIVYSSFSDGVVKAWSGLDGSGTLLGTFTLKANEPATSTIADTFTAYTLNYTGLAESFDLTGTVTPGVTFGSIGMTTTVPEPATNALLAAGLGLVALAAVRRKRHAA